MIPQKVLIVSTYPIEPALHGGQKRVQALVEYYKTLFSEVRFVAIYYKKHVEGAAATDIAIKDSSIIANIEEQPFAGDIILGSAIYDDPDVKKEFSNLLQDYQPDIIEIEQVYPYVGLKPLLAELALNPKLVASSHNVESSMKTDIYKDLKMSAHIKQDLLHTITNAEIELCQRAMLTIVVSPEDAKVHKTMGAKKCVIAPNGIAKVTPTASAIAHWQKFKVEKSVDAFVTFVGSIHPPNLVGFQEMIGVDLSFLPAKSTLMLAGGISQYIQSEYPDKETGNKAFWQRAFPLGKLSDDLLAGLITETELIVLPIVSGGGSNLKTAEAILSGKKVVGTSKAFRSYERYKKLPNITIADTKARFHAAIVMALKAPLSPRTKSEDTLAQTVQWEYCLSPLKPALEFVAYGQLRAYARHVYRKTRRTAGRIKRGIVH